MNLLRFIIATFLFLFTISNASANSIAGQVQIVKGNVSILVPLAKKATKLKRGEKVREDSSIVTKKGSFAKILLINGSHLTVGPNSKIVVVTVKKGDASVINLLSGKLRAKVRKKKEKHFYIKTQTAAMAVRGTDFMATYNHESKNSGLLTFEGQVAIKKSTGKPIDNKSVKKQVESLKKIMKDKVELVDVGSFSNTGKKAEVLDQVRIDENQFSRIKLDPSLGAEELKVDEKTVKKEIEKTREIFKKRKLNPKKGRLKNGGFIAQDFGYYIPPKDKKATKAIGTINSNGTYVPPEGIEIDAKAGFVAKERSKVAKASELNQVLEEQVPPRPDDKNYRRYFEIDDE